jgi:hypothetical protein
MKPTFALDLSRETIALLHRTPKGWLPIGEVGFDAPDLDDALAFLRKTALGLSPMDMACKIVLPSSQVLYTEIHAPGPSREDKRRQIAAALEGRTPYDVADLVFDWSGKGASVKVAVVARETLDEAEAFAVAHRLNPVSFIAIPEPGSFVGEAWFGPTAAAEPLISAGTSIDRDRDAMVILQRDVAPARAGQDAGAAETDPAPATLDETPDATVAPVPPPAPPAALAAEEALPGLEEALNADLTDEVPPPLPAQVAMDPPLGSDDPGPMPFVETEAGPDLAEAPAIAQVESEAARSVAEPAEEIDEAPFTHVADTGSQGDGDEAGPPPAPRPSVLAEGLDDDLPPAPAEAAMVAFASRRAASAGGIPRPVDPNTGGISSGLSGVTRPAAAAATGAAVGRIPAAKAFPGLVTAPNIPGTRAKPKLKPGQAASPAVATPTTVRSPARPGGTFGNAAPQRGRTGVMFIVLVVLLLLSLALIAAWSSFYLSRNGSESAEATAALPEVEDEMLADLQDPDGMTDPLPEAEGVEPLDGGAAALATEPLEEVDAPPMNLADADATDLPLGTLTEAESPAEVPAATDPAASAVVLDETPAAEPTSSETAAAEAEASPAELLEPAPGMAVATDVSAAPALVEDQDEIFLAAMDAPPPALDALALPVPAATADAVPDPSMPPPVFGTVYRFDSNGLLLPTPEGIMSPDGVFLIAGQPPLLPPSRSEVASASAAAAAASAEPAAAAEAPLPATGAPGGSLVAAAGAVVPVDPSGVVPDGESIAIPADPAMAGFRPRPRPEGLTAPTGDDDASIPPDGGTEFAGPRPLPRPATVTAAASASRPAAADAGGLVTADLGAQGASLAAQAEAQAAAAAALEAENPSIISFSKRPVGRPRDLSRAVEAAVAAAVREPDPEVELAAAAPAPDAKPEELDEADEPETASAAPKIPTKASVAKQATFVNAINLSKINLIGTYGTDSRRYALIRQANGRYKKVRVGDRIDGGTVKAITETEVRYQKGGKLVTLKMPKA